MLTVLHIENIAVVERADIEFSPGLNVLTGETGAGKSIVIDALEASLGWRTSREIVRTGAKSALVTATFTGAEAESFCAGAGIEYDGELVLTRRILEDGRSSCRVNGVPVPASQLRELGLRLIDIHGQGDGQRLTNERWHLGYLDGYIGGGEKLEEYRAAYREYVGIKKELDSLAMDEGERERRVDILSFQIKELERAKLVPGEYEEKLRRRDFMKSAGRLSEAVRDAASCLLGSERSDGAVSLIEAAAGSVNHALRWSEELAGLAQRLTELKYTAADVAEELRDMEARLDFSSEELDELDSRLDTIKRAMRKYGGSEEAALETLERSKRELEEIGSSDERIKKLEVKLASAKHRAQKLAGELTEIRKAGAVRLSQEIDRELAGLSMPGAAFEVETAPAELGPDGGDAVRFLIAANAGEAPGRIAKVASGGELSRIMLAMKTVLSRADSVEAMVFDEIDTGVSGIAAQRVAEHLAEIGAGKQVICVTHLPQIAAMADWQFSIEKRVEGGRTRTSVTLLDDGGRERELARLTGGDNITETTLLAAREQLEAARSYKARRAKRQAPEGDRG